MSYDAVVVRKGVWWGYLPPYLPEPVPQIVAALDPAGAVPAAAVLISQLIILTTRVVILFTRVNILASQLAITSKSNTWLFWLFVSSSTASRSLHGFGLLSLFALCSITSSVYRLFEIIFPKISFFRVRYKF